MSKRKKITPLTLNDDILEMSEDLMRVEGFKYLTHYVEQLIREKHKEYFGIDIQRGLPKNTANTSGETGLHQCNEPKIAYGQTKDEKASSSETLGDISGNEAARLREERLGRRGGPKP